MTTPLEALAIIVIVQFRSTAVIENINDCLLIIARSGLVINTLAIKQDVYLLLLTTLITKTVHYSFRKMEDRGKVSTSPLPQLLPFFQYSVSRYLSRNAFIYCCGPEPTIISTSLNLTLNNLTNTFFPEISHR